MGEHEKGGGVKKLKQKLYFVKHQVNPHGKKTPVFSTIKPTKKSLLGFRKKEVA